MGDRRLIYGSGGGGKGGAKDNAPNSLRSGATVRVVDLLGEGEIKGLVNGSRSIFFDNTPLMDESGNYNFEGVSWDMRYGLPDQSYVPGFNSVESEEAVGIEVTKGNPIIRSINGENLDAVRVTATIPALAKQSDDGSLQKNSVQFYFEVRYVGGSWINPFGILTIRGKCTSSYDKSWVLPLPKDPAGTTTSWEVRMVRVTDDSDDAVKNQNATYFGAMTKITYGKFTYPYSAYIAMTVSAEQFGQSIPERTYEVYGRIIQVPSNYDPVNRTYSGIWNGTFKWAWTDNPAWVLYDILSDDRFGLGEYIPVEQIDKWSLYEIAQYCDQNVPDGLGSMKPRFTFNGWISSQQEAFDAISAITSSFRGMAFWSSGSFMATQDRPADVSILAASSNVVDGSFTYQGTALKARHTVAIVKWTNPDLNYEQDYVVVEDPDGIERYGYRETEIEAFGCTDRAQAIRMGEWVLFTELNETQVIGYTAGLDHAGIRPGDIVAVQDPSIAGVEFAGRLSSGNSSTVLRLDRNVTFTAGNTYSISVMLPNGTVQEKPITVTSYGTPTKTVTVASAFTTTPDAETVWVISSSNLVPSLWKVISLREASNHTYEVSAAQHEPSKFAHIDNSARFDPLPVAGKDAVQPPRNLKVQESIYTRDGRPRSGLLFSWSPPGIESVAVSYDISYDGPNGFVRYGNVQSTSITLDDAVPGEYTFYAVSVGFNNRRSVPASITYASAGWKGAAQGHVENVRLAGKSLETYIFDGPDPEFQWDNVWTNLVLAEDGTNPVYRYNIVKIYDTITDQLLRTEYVTGTRYVYSLQKNREDNGAHGRGPSRSFRIEVAVQDVYGRVSAYTSKGVTNPPPAAITPQGLPGFGQFSVRWNPLSDADLAGYLVWISTQQGFNPELTEPYYDGMVNAVTYPTPTSSPYYVRAAAYDTFGKDGLNISGEIEVSSVGTIDTEPPEVPTGLAATSTGADFDPVTGLVTVHITWDANTEDDLAGYILEVKEDGGNFVSFMTVENARDVKVRPASVLTMRVLAYDRSMNKSGFTVDYQHTAAKDDTPPAIPTNLEVAGTFSGVWLKWDANTEVDLSHYELFETQDEEEVPDENTTPTFRATANTLWRGDLDPGLNLYYYIRAVDTSGNASGWSDVESGYTLGLDGSVPPPSVPGNVAATSVVQTGNTGEVRAEVTVTWDASPGASLYEVGVKEGAGNERFATVATNTFTFTGLPNVSYTIRVASIGSFNNKSDYSAGIAHTTAKDDVAPPVPQDLVASPGVGSIWLKWRPDTGTDAPVSDFSHYEVWQSETSDIGDAVQVARSLGASVAITGLSLNSTRYYWVRAVDTSGNISGYSSVASATTGSVPEVDLPTVNGILFASSQGSGNNTLTWSAGSITYDGGAQTKAIDAGQVEWTAGTIFVYYERGDTALKTTNSLSVMYGANGILLGIYKGGTDFQLVNGREYIDGGLILANTIGANQLVTDAAVITGTAQIANAIITDAKIVSLDAAKLTADTVEAKNILVGYINGAATKITPGQITISGSTTLEDWRGTSDTTTINGGKIETSSITAKSILLTDMTNLVQNGYNEVMVLEDYWYKEYGANNNSYYASNTGTTGKNALVLSKVDAGGSTELQAIRPFAVTGGETLTCEISIRAGTAATPNGFYYRLMWYNANMVALSPSYSDIISNGPIPAAYTTYTSKVAVPSAARFARVMVATTSQQTVNNIVVIDYVAVRRANAASLIVDGGIKANHLTTTEAVITGTAQIKDAIITSAKIVELDAAKITAGSVLTPSVIVSGRTIGAVAQSAEVFDNFSQDWLTHSGTANGFDYATSSADVQSGTRSFWSKAVDNIRSRSPDKVPFDPTKLYKITYKVRKNAGTTGNYYLGVAAFAQDGTTFVNSAGGNTPNNQYYAVKANAPQSELTATFQEFSGYIKGTSATSLGNGTLANPVRLHTDARFFSPLTIFNYTTGDSRIIVDSVKIEVVDENAAAVINAGTTTIDPGKILVAGSTTLADWRNGSDTTSIEGGKIAANTITANKLEIGARGISVEGIRFTYNKSTNVISWTSGVIRYTRVDGTATGDPDGYVGVSAGSATWTSGTLFIYWNKGATEPANGATVALTASTSASAANGTDTLVLANYKGGINFVANYGQTIIDGTTIYTGSITATQIAANAITAEKIAAGTISGNHIAANTISAKNMILSDMSNMAGNGWDEGDRSAWSVGGEILDWYYGALSGGGITTAGWKLSSLSRDIAYSKEIATNQGDVFYVEAWCYNEDPNTANLMVRFRMQDGSYQWPSATSNNAKNTWVLMKGQLTAPANAVAACMFLQVNKAGGQGSRCIYSKPVMRRAASAELIVDGAVTASKISVTSLAAISANLGDVNIDAARINSGILNVARIGDLTVDTIKITNGAISASALATTSTTSDTTSDPNVWYDTGLWLGVSNVVAFPVDLLLDYNLDLKGTGSSSGMGGAYIRVLRNGEVIRQFYVAITSSNTYSTNNKWEFTDWWAPAGSLTYNVQIQRTMGNTLVRSQYRMIGAKVTKR